MLSGVLFLILSHDVLNVGTHTRCILSPSLMSVFCFCLCWWAQPVGGERVSERWPRWEAVSLWSEDVVDCLCWVILDLMLICCCVCEMQWVWKRQRGRWADNPVCLMRLNAGIDWSPNHRRKWAWKWMVLCPWLAVELGGWVGGDVSCRKTWP